MKLKLRIPDAAFKPLSPEVVIDRRHWRPGPERDPGYCYLKAGFRHVGETKSGLLAFQMLPDDMPAAVTPAARRGELVAS